jgi:deazaflavin-dependent oxidoreductase (nitroreductase family)
MGLLTPVAVKIGSVSWMPKLLPQIVWTDNLVHRVTRNRYGILDIAGLPSLVLTVPGRKSRIPRSTNLLTVPDGDEWLIAGSNFGAPKSPIWVANLRATDTATIRYRRDEHTVTWREMTGGERDQAWQTMRALWPNFDKYADRTDRVIPVFRLTAAQQ